ncbi:hypothetical protein [Phoenicibacter congonensis]|uniref:hypothetical protein n=1 Tax=Phoenicibacter congonensis TaxID=1944646 RepID=UPI0009A7DB26|nr:hypothetical protein [Phoenicibacter congonensis]
MTKWVNVDDLNEYEFKRIKSSFSFAPAGFNPDEKGLVEITISEPVRDCRTGKYLGREYIDYYPRDFLMPGDDSCGPEIALNAGAAFYNEALEYVDEDMRDVRVGCFKSAELLYFHAALWGNWECLSTCWLNLGYLYEYRLTNDDLWPLWMEDVPKTYHPVLQMRDRDSRAHACYGLAMESGSIEAIYKYADTVRWEKGCNPNIKEAVKLYSQAWEKCQYSDPHVIGSVASRLAGCYEDEDGCVRDLKKAKDFYERAIMWFEISAEYTSLYEKMLSKCKKGLSRVDQELQFE